MPFAKKFRAMMDLPFPGDVLGHFVVESIEVSDDPKGGGIYAYAVRMVLCGPGGQQGVRQALKSKLAEHPTTFSAYGNPYQLWFRKPEIESLGNKRYEVRMAGAGSRIYLADDLHRLLSYLREKELLAPDPDFPDQETLIENYLQEYQAEIRRKVARYQGKVRRLEKKKERDL
jgi:hypothetical protein